MVTKTAVLCRLIILCHMPYKYTHLSGVIEDIEDCFLCLSFFVWVFSASCFQMYIGVHILGTLSYRGSWVMAFKKDLF